MLKRLHGLKDIHTVISNERKIGGTVEASFIRLRSGEEFTYPVFTSIDVSKGQLVTLGFITESDEHIIVHVDEISQIKGLEYKLKCELKNIQAKKGLLSEAIQYLRKLCEINQGFVTRPFKEELIRLVRDISMEEIQNHNLSLPISLEEQNNLIYIKKRLFA